MLEKSLLFNDLKELEKEEFSIDSSPISSKIVNELLPQSRDILSRVTQYLPDYTLHDIQHSYRMLENIENIIPPDNELNIVEIKILIYAIFLHDVGMTSDKVEENLFGKYISIKDRQKRKHLVDKYIKKVNKNSILSDDSLKEFKKLLKLELNFYVKFIEKKEVKNNFYAEYLRKNHVNRSKMKLYLLKNSLNFEYKGICLLNHIFNVILSQDRKSVV